MDSSDVIAVKTRLEDEKSKCLRLENDVEMLMNGGTTCRCELQIPENVIGNGICDFVGDMDSSDVIAVKTRLEDEKSKRLLLENDVEMLMLKVARLERWNGGTPECRQDTAPSNVAFSARLVTSTTLSKGRTLVFDHVITNIGSAYDSTSGVFRVPISGTYVFTVTILCQAQKFAQVCILRDNVRIASVLAETTAHDWHDQGSVTVTLDLKVNEDVHVETLIESFIHANYFTVFSGFLLSEN